MQIIDLLEGRPVYTLKGHEGLLLAIATSHDGNYFSSGGSDKQILVWKTNFTALESEDSNAEVNTNLISNQLPHFKERTMADELDEASNDVSQSHLFLKIAWFCTNLKYLFLKIYIFRIKTNCQKTKKIHQK